MAVGQRPPSDDEGSVYVHQRGAIRLACAPALRRLDHPSSSSSPRACGTATTPDDAAARRSATNFIYCATSFFDVALLRPILTKSASEVDADIDRRSATDLNSLKSASSRWSPPPRSTAAHNRSPKAAVSWRARPQSGAGRRGGAGARHARGAPRGGWWGGIWKTDACVGKLSRWYRIIV